MSIKAAFNNFLHIQPEDHVPVQVANNFKHNVYVNTFDLMFFTFGDCFVSINTIMPVFAANLTDSPLLIGLIPAIVNFGWFLPQLFLSGHVSRLKRKLPFARKMAVIERIPYLLMPLMALLVPHVSKNTALIMLFIVMTLRGLASGMVALPWQEVLASVIPLSHRARFFGVSRVMAQIVGVLGSLVATLVLSKLPYPYNYALGFAIAVVAQWISFAFYSRNKEPEPEPEPEPDVIQREEPSKRIIDFNLVGSILKRDTNLRYYLAGRSTIFIGNMASGFLAIYGIQHFNLTDAQAAIFTGLLFLSGILGYSVGGALGDKVGPKRIVVLSVLTWSLGLIVAIFSPVIWVYYIVFLLYGLYTAGMNMGDSILVMELGQEELRPTYLGMARSLTAVFVLMAPVLAGWLVEAYGYKVMFAVSVVLSLIGAGLMNKVRDVPRRSRVKEPEEETL
ncbi:MAG: MFS transporter [Anaerolineaceae bacterium]